MYKIKEPFLTPPSSKKSTNEEISQGGKIGLITAFAVVLCVVFVPAIYFALKAFSKSKSIKPN